jgi:hypothetical protein
MTSVTLHAQVSTGDVVGNVKDSSGGIIAGAKVTLTQTDRQDVRTGTTNGSGDFVFSLLPSGSYSLMIDAPGFGRYEIKAFVVSAGADRLFE